MFEDDDTTIYRTVVNHEEQYSIWPESHEVPPGWDLVGVEGTKAECLAWIDEHWVDLRPLSLRTAMQSGRGIATVAPPVDVGPTLVERLVTSEQRIELCDGDDGVAAAMSGGAVRVRFLDTRGPTVLTAAVQGRATPEAGGDSLHFRASVRLDGAALELVAAVGTADGAGRADVRRVDEIAPS